MSPTAMPAVSEPQMNGYTSLKDALKAYVPAALTTNGPSSNGVHTNIPHAQQEAKRGTLLRSFLDAQAQLETFKHGRPVEVDGTTLSVPGVVAVARYGAAASLSNSTSVRDAVLSSRRAIEKKVEGSKSVYGVSTGFGGSADTRTSHTLALGSALLQHQHSGILPLPSSSTSTLPLLDPLTSTSMPESWVRGAILIRMNSLIRGHSGVRWELIEKMGDLLQNNITPLVPMRGSISASGDLSPLSYIAGTLIGNPSIRVYHSPTDGSPRRLAPSSKALPEHGIAPLALQSKEHLGILNGTAFSAATAALVLHDAAHLALLAQACTALGTEALLGTRASYDPFIHAVARPHPGQVEAADAIYRLLEGSKFAEDHEEEVALTDDKGTLRQDRYPLRTAPQYLGPQLEDILSALETVTQECNSTTDNPLIDGKTGHVHHGGNFQAMAVTSATEKARLALFHVGKLLFAQSTELLNPAMNRGLPPSLAATDPSLNYHGKGVDIATAAYVSELGFLASPVSTHVQSAEMHNQAVNSLALISARKTIDSVQVLSILSASYLYLLCQALDLRALQHELSAQISHIISEELAGTFGASLGASELNALAGPVTRAVFASIERTSTMDAVPRMEEAAGCAVRAAIEHLTVAPSTITELPLAPLQSFKGRVGSRAADALIDLRRAYLSGEKGPAPASHYLRGTRSLYEFVRLELGVKMHGSENMNMFEDGLGVEDVTIGENISIIYEAIRDGRMHSVVANLFQ